MRATRPQIVSASLALSLAACPSEAPTVEISVPASVSPGNVSMSAGVSYKGEAKDLKYAWSVAAPCPVTPAESAEPSLLADVSVGCAGKTIRVTLSVSSPGGTVVRTAAFKVAESAGSQASSTATTMGVEGMRTVSLAALVPTSQGDYDEDCLRHADGFVVRVRSRRGTGGGAFAGCCVDFERPLPAHRAVVKVSSKYPERKLEVKMERDQTHEFLHAGSWSGSGTVQGPIRRLPEGATRFCVMAVGPNDVQQNEITVTDLRVL